MKADDHQPPSRLKQINRVRHELLQPFQLSVDGDAQRLKGLCRRVDLPVSALVDRPDHQCGKPLGRLNRFNRPLHHQLPRNPPCGPLLTKLVDKIGQLPFTQTVDQIRRRRTFRPIHPHVERRSGLTTLTGPKAEAAIGRIELPRGDPKVDQYSGHPLQPSLSADPSDLAVVRVNPLEPVAEGRQPLTRQLKRLGIPIKSQHSRLRRVLQNQAGVATHSKRAVDNHASPLR